MLGGFGLLLKPIMPVHTILFIIGNLALIWLGLRLTGYTPFSHALASLGNKFSSLIPARFSLAPQAERHPYFTGMAWGCLPCGLLYGVLPFALLSGDPLSGAILMMAFGLAALPHLLIAQGAAQYLHKRHLPKWIKFAGAAMLISLGVYGLLHANGIGIAPLLCITPLH
jgi:sulfite exporter TauE/SafE